MRGDGIIAPACIDDVGAAAAVDDISAGTAGDCIGGRGAHDGDRLRQRQAGCVHVLEAGNGGKVSHRLIGSGEIDRCRRPHHQRVVAGAAVDRNLRAPEIHGIVAGAGIDDIRPGAAMDDVISRTRGNRVGGGGARDSQRRGHRAGVEILRNS